MLNTMNQLSLMTSIFVVYFLLVTCSISAIYFRWNPPTIFYVNESVFSHSFRSLTSSVQSGNVIRVKLSSKLCLRLISGLLEPNCIRMSSGNNSRETSRNQ